MRRRLPNLPYEQDLELFLVGLKSRRFCDQDSRVSAHFPPTDWLASEAALEPLIFDVRSPLCGLCFWLRIQVVPSARGCSADMLVRHVAVERCRWPVGSNRGRDLLRGAVGDDPAPTGRDDGSGYHLERRVGDRAVDPHRGMLLMVCGADHLLFGQRHRKFDMGRCLLRRWDWPLPIA